MYSDFIIETGEYNVFFEHTVTPPHTIEIDHGLILGHKSQAIGYVYGKPNGSLRIVATRNDNDPFSLP